MKIQFTKMHGLGNDFVVIDNLAQKIQLSKAQIQALAHRNFGIGFDQMLLVEHSERADFRYIIYNSDGCEVEQCGNGARCFARFVRAKGLSDNNPLSVETRSGVISLRIHSDNSVSVDMGAASFLPQDSGFKCVTKAKTYQLDNHTFGVVSMGNPHAVICVEPSQTAEDFANLDINPIAQLLQNNGAFAHSANIGFMQILSRREIALRVYERGAGETLACGTGACAAVAHGIDLGRLDKSVSVLLRGGWASVEQLNNRHLLLRGLAEFVFEGEIDI